MRKLSNPRIVVGPHDSMPDVLARLRTASGGSAALAIPSSSSLLLTASEFRALKAAVEQSRIVLTVETDDRLRRQLATMFKIPVIDLLPGATMTLEEAVSPETSAAPTESKRESVIPDLPKLDLPPPLEVAPKWEPKPISDDVDEPPEGAPLPEKPGFRLPIPWKYVGIGVAALLAIVLIGGAAAYVLQTATVTITVKRQPVTANLTYAVVSPGSEPPQGAAFSVLTTPVTMEVPFEKTVPVTGELREPDQIATGQVALRNPTNAPVDIPAGTEFADRDGVEFIFVNAVTVPAATSMTNAGRADAAIQAKSGGENANRDTGLLSGKLDNGIFYSNRNAPIAGGTDKKTPIVAQQDIDQLVADANAEIPNLATSQGLSDGRIVMPGSLQPGELTYTVDHKAGDQAATVSIQANMIVSGMAFSPSDAVGLAADQLGRDLRTNTPAGWELEPDTISYATPVMVNDQGETGLYRLDATANAKVIVDDGQRSAAADAIAGKGVDDAERYLLSLPFVDSVQIKSSPSFLPERIPNAGKIKIQTR